MRLLDLKYFVAIADAGGLTQAADEVGLSQPGLSRILRDLEIQMQTQLVKRTGRGVELTQAGEEFCEFARETLNRYAATRGRIKSLSGQMPERLLITVPIRLERLLAVPLHAAFARDLPDTSLVLSEVFSEIALEMLADGRADVMIGYLRQPDFQDAHVLYTEDLYLVGTPELIGNGNDPIALEKVGDLRFLVPARTHYRTMIETALASVGQSLKVARQLETAEAIVSFAAEGEGAALLPFSNVFREVARGELSIRPISAPGISREIVFNVAGHLSPIVSRLAGACVSTALSEVAETARWYCIPPRVP